MTKEEKKLQELDLELAILKYKDRYPYETGRLDHIVDSLIKELDKSKS